jgi:hypothetical protein
VPYIEYSVGYPRGAGTRRSELACVRTGGPQCPQAAVWALTDGGPRLPSNRRVHGTQKAVADESGDIDNTIITYGRIQELLAEGGVFVTGGGPINSAQTHFISEEEIEDALDRAKNNPVKRQLVRQAALPPRSRMSVCR